MITPTTITIETLALRLATLGADNNTITKTRKTITTHATYHNLTGNNIPDPAGLVANRTFNDPIKATLAAIDHLITNAINQADPGTTNPDGELITSLIDAYDNGINAAKENQ